MPFRFGENVLMAWTRESMKKKVESKFEGGNPEMRTTVAAYDKNYVCNQLSAMQNCSIDRFDEIIPRRQKVINEAPDTEPKYEFNANVLARNLHPKVQHVKVCDIKEFNGARVYTFEPDTSKGTTKLAYFRAGHYISLKLKIGDSVLTRPYSLCSSPNFLLFSRIRRSSSE